MKKLLALLLGLLMVLALAACGQQEPADDVAMQYITAEDLSAALDSGEYLILDVRKAEDYAVSHIPGSVSADMDAAKNGDLEAGKATMTAATEGVDQSLVLVCYSGNAYAQATTNALSAIGYDMSKVFTLEGGFNNWSEVYPDLVEAGDGASVEEVSADDVAAAVGDSNTIILDLRDDDAYLGYAVDGISRGGHIEGAVQFCYTWLSYLEDTTLQDELNARNITSDKNIIVYSSNNEEAADFAAQMADLGYSVSVFNDLAGWADDASRTLVSAPRKEYLVSADWLHELISGGTPETYTADKYVILDCSWGEVGESFTSGHIPGAYHFNTDLMEEDVYWNIRPIDELAEAFTQFGIDKDTCVIVAGNDSANVRIAYALLYVGFDDIRVFNGNEDTWVAAGYELSTGDATPTPVDVADFGYTEFENPQYYIGMPEDVLEAQKDENFRLVSIRSWEEFIGETSGYSYIAVAGEPEGAVWGHNTDAYYDVDGTLRNYDELLDMWAEWDINPEVNHMSFYCGTGWRATVPFWICYVEGLDNISVYDGGWHAWVLDPSLPYPYQTGDPR